jgi:hypothetical protein
LKVFENRMLRRIFVLVHGGWGKLNCGHEWTYFPTQVIYKYGEPRWKPKNLEKNLSSATLYTTNATWADPNMNLGLRVQRPVTNNLSHCMTWENI